MAPPGKLLSLQHRIRRAHPMRLVMRSSLDRMAHASPEEITRCQERRLRALVRLAATRSPFYRNWFAESGVEPRTIRTLEDLPRLPLLERHHLAERSADFLAYPRNLVWPAHSSGTTGSVVTAYRTPGSSIYELASLERQWGWFGLPRGARRAVLRGSDFAASRPGVVTMELPAARQLLVSSFHLTPENLPEILAALRRFRPDAIEAWPSSVTLLAALLRDAGHRFPVRALITSSEVISAAQHELLRDVFAAPVADHYGQTERVSMAGTCEEGSYHVFSDYGIVELLPVDGSTRRWEIVGTPLHNWGFPLFRYRTGDEVAAAPQGPCGCGRAFPLLGAVDGRVEDAFTAADGRHVPLPHTLVKTLTGLRETQVVQRAPGCFEVRMVPGAGFDRATTEALARRNIERIVGQGQTVTFQLMDRIPRSASGKLRPAIVLDDLVGQR
ncbi:MAG: phenylacetate--CoA ligase family protein [Pseudonocardiaceae bacterium]